MSEDNAKLRNGFIQSIFLPLQLTWGLQSCPDHLRNQALSVRVTVRSEYRALQR